MPKINNIPSHFICPISQSLMSDPVLTCDGQMYDRKSIEEWLKNNNTSPVTNLVLENKNLIPAIDIKNQINEFKKEKNLVDFQLFITTIITKGLERLKTFNYCEDFLNRRYDEENETAIFFAARNNLPNFVQYLLNEGVDLTIKNKDGNTPIHIIAALGFFEVAQVLIKYLKDINIQGQDDQTALHYTSIFGYLKIVKLLIQSGADIESRNLIRATPLMTSAFLTDKTDVISFLLDSNANINAIDKENRTALHYAAYLGRTSIVTLLIKRGANIEALANKDFNLPGDNNTPLHLACHSSNRNESTIKTLLSSGSNFEALDSLGNTPLHISSMSGNEVGIKLLLEFGANYKSKNNEGKFPHEISKTPQISQLIIDSHKQN